MFEVLPSAGKKQEYLDLVEYLNPTLEAIDGYVDSERFESRLRPGWMLSLQTWRDEKSVVRWRTDAEHHAIQLKGRFETFDDYHIRGGDVTSDTEAPQEAAVQELRFDETELGKGKMATFTEIVPVGGAILSEMLPSRLGLDIRDDNVTDHGIYASIYNPGKFAFLVSWRDAGAADRWASRMTSGIALLRHRKIGVIRDYGASTVARRRNSTPMWEAERISTPPPLGAAHAPASSWPLRALLLCKPASRHYLL